MEHRKSAYDATYVFSSEQQREVGRIYQKYAPPGADSRPLPEEEKLAELRRLDRSVTRCGNLAALGAGAGGAVLHGAGMALLQQEALLVPGTGAAVAGLLLFLAAFPIHGWAVKRQRRRVEARILTLCRELMK